MALHILFDTGKSYVHGLWYLSLVWVRIMVLDQYTVSTKKDKRYKICYRVGEQPDLVFLKTKDTSDMIGHECKSF